MTLSWILHYSVNWWCMVPSPSITPLPINISPTNISILFVWFRTWWKEKHFNLNFMPENMKPWKLTEKDRHFLNGILRARPNACCQIQWRIVWSKNGTLLWDLANWKGWYTMTSLACITSLPLKWTLEGGSLAKVDYEVKSPSLSHKVPKNSLFKPT